MLLAIKFGGTSVGDGERIRSASELVKRVLGQGHRVVVVTSAMSGVTNKLVGLLAQATAPAVGADENRVAEYFRFTKQLEQDHVATAKIAIRDPQLVESVAGALYMERHGLDRVLLGSHLLGELTPIGYDFVVSEGERFCVPILAACLRDLGVDAVGVGGDEAGIVTDNNYGNSLPNEQRTREGVRKALLPMLDAGKTPVVAGFYGRSENGRIAILGRGGSDFTATLVGCALDADEIWILKHDVDGIKTTDPRLVPSAYTIPEASYEIAAEMALLGAKVLHPKSVQPAARQRIPVRIASSFEPDKPGTRLAHLPAAAAPHVTALTLVRGGAIVYARSPDMGGEGIVSGGLGNDLRAQNIDVLSAAVGFNGGSGLWLVGGPELDKFLAVLRANVDPAVPITVQRKVAVLGIVGERAATAAGILARVARCLEKARTEPLAILQGASPNGIVIALPDDDHLSAALQGLHTELGLDPTGERR